MTLDEYRTDPEFYTYLIVRQRDGLELTDQEVEDLEEAGEWGVLELCDRYNEQADEETRQETWREF